MDEITLTFNNALNVSLTIGDVAFFKDISEDDVYQMGSVTDIDRTINEFTCEIASSTPRPEAGDFIFFAKDSEVNTSGLVGYYASVKMNLTGSAKKELFAVSTEMFQSS